MLAAVPTTAQTSYSSARINVDYRGLDLASQAGRQTLDRRVDAAIRSMCGAPVFGTRDEADALRACRDEARSAVQPQVKKILASAATKVAAN